MPTPITESCRRGARYLHLFFVYRVTFACYEKVVLAGLGSNMTAPILVNEFSKALPSILLSAIIPPAAAYLWDIREKRHAEELRSIDICSRKVMFLSEWIKAQSLCDPDRFSLAKKQVADELVGLKDELAKQLLEVKQLREEKNLNAAKQNPVKSLLLAYTPLGWLTWILHLFYWYYLCASVIVVVLVFISSIRDPGSAFGMLIVTTILSAMILVPINLLAKWSQKRSTRTKDKAIKKSIDIISNSDYVGIA